MKVIEIFRSIQGEGRSQGFPFIFLRLAGCNLDCSWCDTRYARGSGVTMACDDILDAVTLLPGNRVCITGGEPLLQRDELIPLLGILHKRGYWIEIETNGTIDFLPLQPMASICMDVKCPSSGEESDLSLLDHISPRDSVKFVINDEEDCRYAEQVIATHPVQGEIFFSPVAGSDYGRIAEYLLERDLPARLQLQLHKMVGIR